MFTCRWDGVTPGSLRPDDCVKVLLCVKIKARRQLAEDEDDDEDDVDSILHIFILPCFIFVVIIRHRDILLYTIIAICTPVRNSIYYYC